MLESISLKDFQNHRKLVVEFSPTITTIVGESRSGKSALLRALRLVLFNRPSGTAYINHNANMARISLVVDGVKVIRKRAKDLNTYTINGKELHSFGQGVPQEIADLFNVSEHNFQRQHDPAFWLALSPGEVSKELNAVVNLDLIDRTLSNLGSQLRKATTAADLAKERLDKTTKRLEALHWCEEAAVRIERIEKAESDVAELQGKVEALRSLISKVQKIKPLLEQSPPVVELSDLLKQVRALQDEQRKMERLESLIKSVTEVEDKLCSARIEAAKAQKKLSQMTAGKCPMCGKVSIR